MARNRVDDGLPNPGETVEETPVEVNKPDPWMVLDRLTGALEALAAQRANPTSSGESGRLEALLTTLTPALARLAEAQVEGSKLIADETRRAHRPSNEVVHQRSAFNRRGVTLPDDAEGPIKRPLKCTMLLPWLAEWESLTREEVDLLNLVEPGDYTITRIDKSKIRISVSADFKVDGKTMTRLVMTHDTGFNNDNFRLMPALPDYLRQMLKQHPLEVHRLAAAVMTDEEEEALIEAGALSVSV